MFSRSERPSRIPAAAALFFPQTGNSGSTRLLLMDMPKSIIALASSLALCCAASPAAGASLTPDDIHSAYALPKTGAAHQTIAIVSAYDDPHVRSDLNAYTTRFKVPACTAANGCFRVVNQSGASAPLPQRDPTGGTFLTESSIGVELARGVCQSCSIVLVEANSLAENDLSAAAATASRTGAQTIVTSFNLTASAGNSAYAGDYASPHSIVVAASGDSAYGFPPSFPASLPDALAVGGTELKLSSAGAYGSETAWTQTSSGCALSDSAPAWQAPLAAAVGCASKRAVADLSAVADPGAVVHIQDAETECGNAWCEASGTSISAPIIAGVIGLAGSQGSAEPQMLYAHAHSDPGAFRDITTGSTQNCTGAAICSARRGYDGPSGLGTPYGLAAFLANGGAINGRHPNIGVSAPRNRVTVSRGWRAKLTLRNNNPFAVRVTVALTRRLRVSGRLRLITFASARATLGPLAGASQSPTISTSERALLKRLGTVGVTAAVTARGPAGAAAPLSRTLQLSAP